MARAEPSTGTAERPGSVPGETRPRRVSVPVLALGGFTIALINTLPIPLLSRLPELLGTSSANASWTVTATLLTAAVSTPIGGRLGDMYGKRLVLLWCLGLMTAGSALCAVADSAGTLIAGRALQGCAAGSLPLGLSIIRDELPRERLGPALGFVSSMVGVGSTVGFPLSAFVSQTADWHLLFWAVAVLGVVNFLLVSLLVPESPVRFGGRFDWIGAVALSTGLVCLLLVLSKGGSWGWTSGPTTGTALAGAVVLCGWVRYELRTEDPLVDLRASAGRPVLLTNAATLFVGFAMFAISLILPQLLQAPRATGYGAGFSMVTAGLCLAPAGAVMMLASLASSRLSDAWGARGTLVTGAVILGTGYAAGIPLIDGAWWLMTVSVLVGAGLGLAVSALPALIAAHSPAPRIASANGLNALMRSIGMSLSSAVLSAIFAHSRTTAETNGTTAFFPSPSAAETALLTACAACASAAVTAVFIRRELSSGAARTR